MKSSSIRLAIGWPAIEFRGFLRLVGLQTQTEQV